MPLSQAIATLGRQAGVEILLNAPGREQRRTHGVRGRVSAGEALVRLTQGMGLSVRQVAPRVYLVVIAPRVERKRAERAPPRAPPTAEILVSARRRAEFEEDVPLMVTQRGPEALQHGAVRTLADLARLVPGFVATGQTSSATPLLVARGQRRSINDENRLPLVVYQSEVPLPNQAALAPLYDIASIEVLRGPQGTLFGRNTTSGAVLIRPAQPGGGVPSYLEVERGDYGLFRLEAAIEPPAQGPFSFRLSGQHLRRDGYARLLSGGRVDDAHSDALRAVLRFAPAGPLRSTLSFDMLNADEMGVAPVLAGVYQSGSARRPENVPYYDCGGGSCDVDSYYDLQQSLGERTSQAGVAPYFQRRFRGLSNVTEYGDDRLLFRNIAGWQSTAVIYALDGDGTPLAINDSFNRSHSQQWTEEFQVQGRTGGLRYIGGIFYLYSAPSGPMVQTISRYVRPDNPPYHVANYQTFRSAAMFGQVMVPITRNLVADAGLRYTAERTSGCALRSVEAEPLSRGQCVEDGGSPARAGSRHLTWTLALTRKLGDHSVYLTSRRAFRSGGYNTPQLGGILAPYQTFKPETLTDLELGAKGRWASGGIAGSYTIAAYVGFYDDVQRALFPDTNFDGDDNPATDPIAFYVNTANARVAGIDGDLSVNLGSRIHVTLSASWIDARYTRIIAPAALLALLGADPIHNRFTYMPSFSGALSVTRDFPLGAWGRLDISADYSHVSSTRFTERPDEAFARQPAYGLLGTAITWRNPAGLPIEMELWGRNLTDRFYVSAGGTLSPSSVAATVIPGPPRTIGLRLRYGFE